MNASKNRFSVIVELLLMDTFILGTVKLILFPTQPLFALGRSNAVQYNPACMAGVSGDGRGGERKRRMQDSVSR